MPPKRSAADYFPPSCDPASPASCGLGSLRDAARGCHGCDLYIPATQTVFGEGDPDARLMVVGEEPGNEEDLEGEPFVGPAGGLLDRVLDQARIDRSKVWVTNAVKHFKFEHRGARRIHVSPAWGEIEACRPWLEAEIDIVQPQVTVLLGATAAKSVLGRGFLMTHHRGEWLDWDGPGRLMTTWHPSAVLRGPEREDRHRKRAEMVEDFRKVSGGLAKQQDRPRVGDVTDRRRTGR